MTAGELFRQQAKIPSSWFEVLYRMFIVTAKMPKDF